MFLRHGSKRVAGRAGAQCWHCHPPIRNNTIAATQSSQSAGLRSLRGLSSQNGRNGDGSTNSGGTGSHTLVYPDPPSTQHHNLATFLAHAERSGLDEKSTVFVGTHFEYTVASSLSRYGFSLRRVGGASDYGTDLLGVWTPPTTSLTLRVIVQCKAGAQRAGPNLIRELEGAFVGAPAGWRGSGGSGGDGAGRASRGVLGLLVSQQPATKGVRESLARSRWPMGYICCARDGRVRQMLWNGRAEDEGLEGLGVTMRYKEGTDEQELVLVRDGKRLPMLGGEG